MWTEHINSNSLLILMADFQQSNISIALLDQGGDLTPVITKQEIVAYQILKKWKITSLISSQATEPDIIAM